MTVIYLALTVGLCLATMLSITLALMEWQWSAPAEQCHIKLHNLFTELRQRSALVVATPPGHSEPMAGWRAWSEKWNPRLAIARPAFAALRPRPSRERDAGQLAARARRDAPRAPPDGSARVGACAHRGVSAGGKEPARGARRPARAVGGAGGRSRNAGPGRIGQIRRPLHPSRNACGAQEAFERLKRKLRRAAGEQGGSAAGKPPATLDRFHAT